MIIGSIIGLASSFIPELIKIFKSRQEHKQELELLELQLRYQKEMSEIRIEESRAAAKIELDKYSYQYAPIQEIKPTGKWWIDAIQVIMNAYNQSVRPTITYLMIGAWLLLKFSMWQSAGGTLEAIPKIWSDYENEFVSIVVTFWMGGRLTSRVFGRIK
jgi:hypothetical protein